MSDRDNSSKDGTFHLQYADGHAVLSVTPPAGNGKPVYAEEVMNRMRLLGIPRVRLQTINRIIAEADGKAHRIVAWPAGAELSAVVELTISDDRLTAWVRMKRPRKGGAMVSAQDIVEFLARSGITNTVLTGEVEEMVRRKRFDVPVEVARGRAPRNGEAPRVLFTFSTERGKPFLLLQGGRIDLKELNFIQNKHEGDVLARMTETKPQEDGVDIFGLKIYAEPPGKAERIEPGRNTALSENGKSIVSLIDGNAFVEDGRVHVEPIVVVRNVNYETGNIDFQGSVVVQRTIADGFTVKAQGSIEVRDCVGRVQLHAGRDLMLKGGTNSGQEGVIECDGNLYAKFIEGATVSCGSNLYVQELVMHSALSVRGNLLMAGRRAELIGGSAIIGGSVWCKKTGSISETPTRIAVGVAPTALGSYARLIKKIDDKKTHLDELDANIGRLKRHVAAGGERAEEAAPALHQLRLEADALSEELKVLSREAGESRRRLVASESSMMVVENRIYPGTVVSFGREDYRPPSRGTQKTILKWTEGRIVESGFNRADPPKMLFE